MFRRFLIEERVRMFYSCGKMKVDWRRWSLSENPSFVIDKDDFQILAWSQPNHLELAQYQPRIKKSGNQGVYFFVFLSFVFKRNYITMDKKKNKKRVLNFVALSQGLTPTRMRMVLCTETRVGMKMRLGVKRQMKKETMRLSQVKC